MADAARLAPDAAALGAAQRVAVRHLWPIAAASERALWGECIGSERYKVAVDLSDATTRCTCPSRKLPCKHALALMLLAADGLPTAGEPDDVASWVDKRASSRRAKDTTPVKDAAAQVARKEARVEKVDQGIERFDRFLEDVMRQGLGALDGAAGAALLENEARRLIDAQAGGLASRLRGVAARIGTGGDWAGLVLDRLGRMALLSEAWARQDALGDIVDDLRAQIGFSVPEAVVREHNDVVRDTWFVLSDTVELVDQLRSGRAWLRGKTSGRDALMLRFAPGNAPFADTWAPGSEVQAALAFYPSAWPQRALVLERAPPTFGAQTIPRTLTLGAMLQAWSEALARQPWLERLPVALGPVEVTADRVFDADGAVPLVVASAADLLAVAGGGVITLAGEWTGEAFVALGVMTEGYSVLATTPPLVPYTGHSSRFGRVSVLGTARRPLRDEDQDPELAQLDGPVERRILLAAGCEAIRRVAARVPLAVPERVAPAPPEVRAAIPEKLARRVEALLGDAQLAPEIVRSIDHKGLRLTPELLSRALPFVRARPELLGVLGERGRWLAGLGVSDALTAAYAKAPHVDDPERVFAEGSLDARTNALRELRRRDRERARAVLLAAWKEDKPEVRAAFLAVMREALGDDDLPFLRAVETDRSVGVRRRARALVGELPGTDVNLRHRRRIEAICHVPRLALPVVEGDAPPDPEWLDDGITHDGAASVRLGPRAWLLADLAATAPPTLWSEVAGLAPGPLVEALLANEDVHAWLLGLAWRPLDAAWATAVSFGIPSIAWPEGLRVARDDVAEVVLAQVPEPTRDRLAARWYLQSPTTRFSRWGPELSRAILRHVEMNGERFPVPNLLAVQLHPSLLQTALDLPVIRRAYRIAALLELRRQFHQELNLVR